MAFYLERYSLVSMVSVYEVPVIRKHRTSIVQNAILVSISRVMTLRIRMEDKFFEQSKIIRKFMVRIYLLRNSLRRQ